MKDTFYITSAIPYVNADPHIGTVMDPIQADVLARYHRQRQTATLLSAGTDVHGAKITEVAEEQGLEPQELTEQTSERMRSLFRRLNVSFDCFVRTSDPEHKRAAQEIWRRFSADIYKSSYHGWYCVGCEEHVTQEYARENDYVCPDHNRAYETIEEENYFFALNKYTQQIKDAITREEYCIIPEKRKNEILSLLDSGLQDVSFSRPKDKLSWGVEVPDDPEHVMYVWPDALTNYLTATGFPDEGYDKWWPADMHVIGKGILRFHAAIWPGMLLAAGLPLPKQLFVHDYFTFNGDKMSKSQGNFVAPSEVIDAYGTDALRYYLLHEAPSSNDGDFTWERLETVYNSDLADDLGNLVNRVGAMIDKYQNGAINSAGDPAHDIADYHQAISECRFEDGLDVVMGFVKDLNRYIEEEKPWEIAKTDEEHLGEVLSYLASNLAHAGWLLAPFLPETGQAIYNAFSGEKLQPLEGPLFPKRSTAEENPR
jgi:methionyl-tRNA synthetase